MRQAKHQLEEISGMLEQLLDDKPLQALQEDYHDSLDAKIKHQLVRLSEKMSWREKQALEERDVIKNLIAEIAHQMRNPLANLETYLELLAGTTDPNTQQTYLQALRESEQKLSFLTENFIKMARLEQKIIQIHKQPHCLYDTLLGCILQVQSLAEAKSCQITLEADPALSASYDANWLAEAIGNLLDNSVKYSPTGSTIRIRAAAGELYTQIAVSDTGIGILEQEENRIFQRFYRGAQAAGAPGFGLGLYIAREIVLLHGGFLKAKRLQPGLEVSIFLP